jgi:hypothetical protein
VRPFGACGLSLRERPAPHIEEIGVLVRPLVRAHSQCFHVHKALPLRPFGAPAAETVPCAGGRTLERNCSFRVSAVVANRWCSRAPAGHGPSIGGSRTSAGPTARRWMTLHSRLLLPKGRSAWCAVSPKRGETVRTGTSRNAQWEVSLMDEEKRNPVPLPFEVHHLPS